MASRTSAEGTLVTLSLNASDRLVSLVAKYSSPVGDFTPWQEKWARGESPYLPAPKQSAIARSTSWLGLLRTVWTSKQPTVSSRSTSAKARASWAGALRLVSFGSLYASIATIKALRTP